MTTNLSADKHVSLYLPACSSTTLSSEYALNKSTSLTCIDEKGQGVSNFVPISRLIVASVITWLIIINNIINLVVLRRMTSVNSRVKALMASMSVSDLLLGIIVCLPSQVSALVQFWPFTNALCQVTGIVNGMSISVSMWSLTAISVERYLVIVQPLHFNQQPRLRHVQLGIAFIWVFNTFYYVIPVCIHPQMSYYVYQADMLVCGFVWEPDWMLYLAGALYPIGPGFIIVFCSYQIIQVIRQSNSRIISMVSGNTNARPAAPVAANDSSDNVKDDSESDRNSSLNTSAPDADVKPGKITSVAKKKKSKPQHLHSNLRKATIRREAKVSKVMIITAAAFFSCSFPYLCSAVVEKNGVSITNWHSFCVMWLLNCNSFINVFIYSTTYPEFRYLFKVIFLPCCYPEQSTAKARNVSSHR